MDDYEADWVSSGDEAVVPGDPPWLERLALSTLGLVVAAFLLPAALLLLAVGGHSRLPLTTAKNSGVLVLSSQTCYKKRNLKS